MPLEFVGNEVRLIDVCPAEEALELVDWLANAGSPKVDLAACTHVHAALLQTLLAFKPAISVEPQDPFLRKWIVPALAAAREQRKD